MKLRQGTIVGGYKCKAELVEYSSNRKALYETWSLTSGKRRTVRKRVRMLGFDWGLLETARSSGKLPGRRESGFESPQLDSNPDPQIPQWTNKGLAELPGRTDENRFGTPIPKRSSGGFWAHASIRGSLCPNRGGIVQ